MYNLYFLIKPIKENENGELTAEWHSINNLPIASMLPIDHEMIPILKALNY
jgi:hypothetical protein